MNRGRHKEILLIDLEKVSELYTKMEKVVFINNKGNVLVYILKRKEKVVLLRSEDGIIVIDKKEVNNTVEKVVFKNTMEEVVNCNIISVKDEN